MQNGSTGLSDAELISDTESVGEPDDVPQTTQPVPTAEENKASDVDSEEELKKAEEFKDKGNAFFKASKYEQAIEQYTESIFCKVTPAKKAVYYCNRALSNLKMENHSFALFDACEAIKQDPKNVKGYYRRGQAYVALRQLKNAVADFK